MVTVPDTGENARAIRSESVDAPHPCVGLFPVSPCQRGFFGVLLRLISDRLPLVTALVIEPLTPEPVGRCPLTVKAGVARWVIPLGRLG